MGILIPIESRKCLLTQATKVETPLGDLDVDTEAIAKLKESVCEEFGCSFLESLRFLQHARRRKRAQPRNRASFRLPPLRIARQGGVNDGGRGVVVLQIQSGSVPLSLFLYNVEF